jgi:hypothetical protein
MNAHYHIDSRKYTLQQLKTNLLSREMIPSRKALKEDLERRFEILEKMGILNLQDLINALKNNKKMESFSASSGISVDYLTLLRREANSYLPNPVPLNKFPGVSPGDLNRLKEKGIKNSRHLFERAGFDQDRKELAKLSGVPLEKLNELVGLSDLVRAYGVGPVFARILYDTGIHSIRKLIGYSPEEIIHLYEEKFNQKADFSLRDMQFCLEIARALDP